MSGNIIFEKGSIKIGSYKKYKSRTAYLLDHLPSKCSRILDVGNIGEVLNLPSATLRQIAQSRGCSVIGCDINLPKAIEMHLTLQVIGDILFLPFRKETFDCVYLGEILEHLWDPFCALKEVFRVMKPSATLIINVPNVFALSRILKWVFWGRDTIGASDHRMLFTPAILLNMLKTAGFKLDTMTTIRKIRLGPFRLEWIPFGNRLGAYLAVTAKRDNYEI